MISSRTAGQRKVARRGGRPKAADVDKLNQDIIAAAGDLFMEYGFDGTSMDAVARKGQNIETDALRPSQGQIGLVQHGGLRAARPISGPS